MKPIFFVCLLGAALLGHTGSLPAQVVDIAEILQQDAHEIATYDTSEFGRYQLALYCPYGSARLLNAAQYDSIRAFGKIFVEYVYTRYTQSQPNQEELDMKRFQALKKLAPDLFEDVDISWEIVVQTSATTAEEARQLFHGFVITYQPPVTEERKVEIREDLQTVIDCAKKRPPPDAAAYPGGMDSLAGWLGRQIIFPEAVVKTGVPKMASVEFKIDPKTGKPTEIVVTKGVNAAHNEQIKAALAQMPAWQPGNPVVRFNLILQFQVDDRKKPKMQTSPLFGYDPVRCREVVTDSTVTKVLQRQKNWKKMLIVEDVTGSMLPYVADLLIWNALKSNLQNTSHFVFFNDGDNKGQSAKEIGKTGGIYHTKPQKVDAIQNTMVTAMAGGNGGDTPENDIEAILEGIKACPECEEVVLIADNNAIPRDLSLLSQVTKPVHVILCGIKYFPNPAHLNIAYKTKGSLHTLKQDVETLAKMQEGETLNIMGAKYLIMKGEFIKVTRE